MALSSTEEAKLKELKENLTVLLRRSPEELIQEDRLGSELCFRAGVPQFQKTLFLFSSLNDADLSQVPFSIMTNIDNAIKDATSIFSSIIEFSPDISNPKHVRDTLIDNVTQKYEEWFKTISPIIAFCIREGTDFQALQAKANDTLHQIEALQINAEETSASLLKSTEETLEKVRHAAAEVGVSQHATHFKEEASDYTETSKKWLWATAISACITLLWGLFAFQIMMPQIDSSPLTNGQFFQALISRGSVLLLLFMALIWCSKNYASAKHNYVINKHRQNALSTFETFVKAAGDSDIQTKNAVLLQATQCIFSPQTTGYSNKSYDSDPPTKIIEIAKDLSKMSK